MACAVERGAGGKLVNTRWRGLTARFVPLLILLALYLTTREDAFRLIVGLWLLLTAAQVASRWWRRSWGRGDKRVLYTESIYAITLIGVLYVNPLGLAFAVISVVVALYTEFLDATVPTK